MDSFGNLRTLERHQIILSVHCEKLNIGCVWYMNQLRVGVTEEDIILQYTGCYMQVYTFYRPWPLPTKIVTYRRFPLALRIVISLFFCDPKRSIGVHSSSTSTRYMAATHNTEFLYICFWCLPVRYQTATAHQSGISPQVGALGTQ